jgi:hypothetical protein
MLRSYRIFYVDESDRVVGQESFEAEDDTKAIAYALEHYAWKGKFLLWQGPREVAVLPNKKKPWPLAAARPAFCTTEPSEPDRAVSLRERRRQRPSRTLRSVARQPKRLRQVGQ